MTDSRLLSYCTALAMDMHKPISVLEMFQDDTFLKLSYLLTYTNRGRLCHVVSALTAYRYKVNRDLYRYSNSIRVYF